MSGVKTDRMRRNKEQVRQCWLTSIHTCWSYVHTPRDVLQTCSNFTNGASLALSLRRRISKVMLKCGWATWRGPRAGQFVWFWASGGAKFTSQKPRSYSTNRRAQCHAAIFILGGGIRIRTNTHTHKNEQTANDNIHTLPIGMCG